MRAPSRAVAAATVLLFATALSAQVPKTDPSGPVGSPSGTAPPAMTPDMTAADVTAFFDGLIPYQLDREDIAGAVIAIVKDGQVLFAKGYGYADTTKKSPVTVETLFRPGSISKLFTWTAVMQLVEQRKLDLDRDVNQYIDFSIPAPFGKPLTLRHLMTHTPGFEEAVKDLFVRDQAGLQPLKDYLVTHLPKQIYPPGTTPAYSNYGTTLAGYIVERAAGIPFEDYIERFIFNPLGMSHCSFRQPLPESLRPLMSAGYARASAGPKSYEFVAAFPAGSSAVSAMDMTRFMLAHLQNGEHDGARILSEETTRLMHARHFGLHPEMNGMALGFYEESRNGHRIIGHGGDTLYFHSDLHLVPDARLGIYLSYNSGGKGEANVRKALWTKFLDRYLPDRHEPGTAKPSAARPAYARAADEAREVAGYYVASRRADTTVIAFTNGMDQSRVYTNADGTISANFARALNGAPQKFRAIAPMMFKDIDSSDRLAFQRDSSGRLTIVVPFPAIMFQQTSGIGGRMFNAVVLMYSLGVIVLALLLWPIGALVRWHYGRKLEILAEQRRLRWIARLVCALNLAAVIVAVYLGTLQATPGAFSAPLDPMLRLMQTFALLGALGSLIAIVHAIRTVRSRAWWWTKVQESAIALACVSFTWFMIYWHVLTPSLKY